MYLLVNNFMAANNSNIPMTLNGGRGKKAPYETTHVRVPVPLKEVIQALIDNYRWTEHIPSIDDLKQKEFKEDPCYEDVAIEIANQILKSKKGAKVSMEKLLTGIYSKEIVL
jgi:hypothetical protein